MNAETEARILAELHSLRIRVKRQRAELKRLNKVSDKVGMFWLGYRGGISDHAITELRGKMMSKFGYKEVWEAEHGKPYPHELKSA